MALELDEDPAFHRAEWRVERIGWVCLALVILAALLGLLGRGPLGERTVTRGPLRIRYDKVMRRSAPGTLEISVSRKADATALRVRSNTDSTVQLSISRALLDGCEPQDIMPPPVITAGAGDRMVFTLAVASQAPSVTLSMICSPDVVGRHAGAIGLVGGPDIPVRTFVLP